MIVYRKSFQHLITLDPPRRTLAGLWRAIRYADICVMPANPARLGFLRRAKRLDPVLRVYRVGPWVVVRHYKRFLKIYSPLPAGFYEGS